MLSKTLKEQIQIIVEEETKNHYFKNNSSELREELKSTITSKIKELSGISDFLVVCDETNNTNSNEFVVTVTLKEENSDEFDTLEATCKPEIV